MLASLRTKELMKLWMMYSPKTGGRRLRPTRRLPPLAPASETPQNVSGEAVLPTNKGSV
jgi:hypothetical protein